MTAEQKYLFDLRGWLLIPGVLSESDVAPLRDFAVRLHYELLLLLSTTLDTVDLLSGRSMA